MSCGTIIENYLLDCDNQPVGGVQATLFLFNYEQFQSATVTYDTTNKSQITGITLGSGDVGYKIEGVVNSVRPQTDMSKEGGRTRYKHIINFQVGGQDEAAVEYVRKLDRGSYVCILILNAQVIYVYGIDAGMETVGQTIQDLYANSGVFTLQLASNDETLETKPPAVYTGAASPYVFATAKAEIEALIQA